MRTPAAAPAAWQLLNNPELDPGQIHIHLVGIGGTGLSAIGRLLLARGYRVSGSDLHGTAITAELGELGATVFIGHRAEQVAGADLVLISSAVPPNNPEVVAAQEAGIPVVKREQFLGPLTAGYLSICVAGTHGKTTTSALIVQLLDAAGAEPSFIVGSTILSLGTNARQGRPGGPFVIEADEYDRAFLGLRPDIAVITNVEWDHVDCYPDRDRYRLAFRSFLELVPAGGTVVYCGDDDGARQLRAEMSSQTTTAGPEPRWVSYGLAPEHEWSARHLRSSNDGGTDFVLLRQGRAMAKTAIALPGEHNVRNVLAALAAAAAAGHDFTEADKNLKILPKLSGTARRLEHKGESCGIIVLDDYAHHPTEVRATLNAARQRYPHRALWVLFQPHTYSRTRALLSDFATSFENADHVLIADIYAAREHNSMGISARDLLGVLEAHPDARYVGDLQTATETLLGELRAGDVLLTLGAGDSYRVGEDVLATLRRRARPQRLPSDSHRAYDELAQAIGRTVGVEVRRGEPLARHTTMRIGGPADLFVAVRTADELVAIWRLAHQYQVPITLLGGGSNVLVSDRGVRGLVIANHCRTVRRHEGAVVWAEGGASLAGLARQAMQWGLSGLEWGVSIPGTVGGAVIGNAGAHGGAIADVLLRATLLQPDGTVAEWPAARFRFAYRTSSLKEALRAGHSTSVVLAAAFQLMQADSEFIRTRAARFLDYRRATQPVEASVGSIFQNPPDDYAGRILDILGFKGRRRGDAAFSTVHANFIVNLGQATANDVLALIEEARRAAWQQAGIELMPEIIFVGEWDRYPPYRPLRTYPRNAPSPVTSASLSAGSGASRLPGTGTESGLFG